MNYDVLQNNGVAVWRHFYQLLTSAHISVIINVIFISTTLDKTVCDIITLTCFLEKSYKKHWEYTESYK